MRYLNVFLLLLVFTSFLIACKNKEKIAAKDVKGAPPPMRVQGFLVKTSSIAEKIELPGTIIAGEETEIHPEIAGRLTYLTINEGKTVSKGALIAQIYDGDLRAQLNKLSVQLKVQEQTIKRYEELLKINGVSRQEYDLIVLQASNIKADMAVIQSNLTRTQIRAPFSGKLGLKMISTGAYVTPQSILTTIRQTSTLKVDFTLPEIYSGKLQPAQTINFKAEGNDKLYTAKVTATEAGISEENRSLHVRATVINADNQLLPGAFAKIKLDFAPDNNAIMIPSQAVIPQARGKKVAIYKGGNIAMTDVVTGIRDSTMVQVLSGLQPGDTIITTGLLGLKPKSKVIVTKVM